MMTMTTLMDIDDDDDDDRVDTRWWVSVTDGVDNVGDAAADSVDDEMMWLMMVMMTMLMDVDDDDDDNLDGY